MSGNIVEKVIDNKIEESLEDKPCSKIVEEILFDEHGFLKECYSVKKKI